MSDAGPLPCVPTLRTMLYYSTQQRDWCAYGSLDGGDGPVLSGPQSKFFVRDEHEKRGSCRSRD